MKLIAFTCLLATTMSSYAFTCHFTLMKGPCWKNYDVDISIKDSGTKKNLLPNNTRLAKGKAGKGGLWQRVEAQCQPMQSLSFEARIQPAVWKGHENDRYHAKRFWLLPKKIKAGVTAWNLPICFAKDFSGVPLPTTAVDECDCEAIKKSLPAIAPK